MSELKQEILDLLILNGRKPQTIKNGERVVYLYDALNIVNKEFSKADQPAINENQMEKLSDIKELLETAIYQPLSSEDSKLITESAMDLVNQLIKESGASE